MLRLRKWRQPLLIAIALLIVLLFEAVLSAIRSYVSSHTTSKLDIELGARLFRHLLQLPISYFHSRRVGDSVARVRELESIRSLLDGTRNSPANGSPVKDAAKN